MIYTCTCSIVFHFSISSLFYLTCTAQRSKFIEAISANVLALTSLLSEVRVWEREGGEGGGGRVEGCGCEVGRVLDVISVVDMSSVCGDYSVHCRVVANLTSFFFACLRQTVDSLSHSQLYCLNYMYVHVTTCMYM